MFTSHHRIVDLTHPIHDESLSYPGDPPCSFVPHATVQSDGYRVTALTMGSHHGTHLDAPSHFIADGAGVDALSLEHTCGPAYVIDVRHKGAPGSVIDVADLEPFAHRILPSTRLLLRTGWDAYYGGPAFFRDAPSLTVAACEWLAARGIWMLGMDLPTLHPTAFRATHIPLLQAGIVIVEALRLNALADSDDFVYFFAPPLALVGLDGSPLRAFALVGGIGTAEPMHEGVERIDPQVECPEAPQPVIVAIEAPKVAIMPVVTASDMLAALDIRRRVFVDEQGVSLDIELDAADREALHVLATMDATPIGTLRIIRHGERGAVGRFAVLKEHRNNGVGRAMIEWVIKTAPLLGLRHLDLHAQTDAAGFYRRAGFRECGPEFVEAGILHVPMERPVL